ncbi:DUF418 domain-containing protein [Streptomyces sp. ISL-98]|uniref:DUF418 domain-containing protein n=1 Tax=Streptomyces sp. ISL-98 TaxID=2819192 RepID=UPI001BEBD4D4|nr:DUF418 domain-containing protein [Streptomyces sp. ISL-98]MBT2504609.1 DUF418 domain-containing protein [Streptomyces sp. ISL-98]
MTESASAVGRPPVTGEGEDAGTGARQAGRLPLLDVLRGAAILGTLMTNVWIFTSPGAEWGILSGTADRASGFSLPVVAEGTFRFLADGKFLAMLTILFGVGLAIQFGSAAKRGQPWPGRYRWRALFLFAEGTLHFVLVFAWDVLMGYAVTALLVAWLLTRSDRFRRVVMWGAAGLHLAGMSLLTLALVAAGSDGDASDGVDSGVDSDVVALYADGGYLEQVTFRLQHAAVLRIEPVLSFALLVFLFLLGVRLFRAGAFSADERGRRIRARMLGWGLGVGLPLNAAAALGGPDFFLFGRYVAAPVMAVGYIGLIGVLSDRVRKTGLLTLGLTSVGRTALTCYVAQNVLCVVVSYGFGLGLAARLEGSGPWWVMGLWAAVCLTLMAGSVLWLRRFSHGPLEAVQRWALRR